MSELQMTPENIRNVYQQSKSLNLPLLKEATRQVELKVQDEHSRKERIDTRTYTLLTILLGLISIISVAITTGYFAYPWLLGTTGIMLIISTMYLFQVLKPRSYIERGSSPKAWLFEDYIRGHEPEELNHHILSIALADRLCSQEPIIKLSDISNNKRVKLLDRALVIMQCSMIPMILSFVCEVSIAQV
jgi:hypothetical protein